MALSIYNPHPPILMIQADLHTLNNFTNAMEQRFCLLIYANFRSVLSQQSCHQGYEVEVLVYRNCLPGNKSFNALH